MSESSRLKDRYDLKESLGHGGMGVVRRAYDTVLRCDVAVKLIRDTPEPASLQLFYRECETLASLNHPNIVQILDQGEFEEDGLIKPYFVMPLLPGATLDKLLQNGALGIERTLDILTQVCRGLGAAHEHNVVHRDLKPSNIFVMRDDSVEIIDFGVCHMTHSVSTKGQKGTLAYMAPELLELKAPSLLSDIYSLGVMAYQMLTGRLPFDRPTESELIAMILHEPPLSILELNPNLSEAIARVIHKAMAKQPWHRFGTTREFSECLQKAHRGEPIAYFDLSRIQPRIDRAQKACGDGDFQFASEILAGLESEGHIHSAMTALRHEIDQALRHKRVEQLLEMAQARIEADETSLAFQRVEEILVLEPGNPRALAMKATIETAARERQVGDWLRLAKQHLDNGALQPAREAANSVLNLNPGNPEASRLLSEIELKERERLRLREERQNLYDSAVRDYQHGSVNTALLKMERAIAIDPKSPGSGPGKDTGLHAFYHEVRSEAESIRTAHEEARTLLDNQDFSGAMAVCERIAQKYPDNALFKTLRFDIEEKQHLRLSAFIAEVDRRAEAEGDLQRKFGILQEALAQFPNEDHFVRAAKLLRDRLALATNIEQQARKFESNSQFDEAIVQWQTLDTVYPNFAGLPFEVERLKQRREEQRRLADKTRSLEQVERLLAAGQFAKASEATRTALQSFDGDAELLHLEKTAQLGVDRQNRVQTLVDAANEHFNRGEFDSGIEGLKQALKLDDENLPVRGALVSRLNERVRSLMEADCDAAANLVEQALFFDPQNATANSLRLRIEDRKQEKLVTSAISGILESKASGDKPGAQTQLDSALQQYPTEARLLRLQRQRDLEEIRRLAAGAALSSQDAMRDIAARYPGDADFRSVMDAANVLAKPPANVGTTTRSRPAEPPPPPPPPQVPSRPQAGEPQARESQGREPQGREPQGMSATEILSLPDFSSLPGFAAPPAGPPASAPPQLPPAFTGPQALGQPKKPPQPPAPLEARKPSTPSPVPAPLLAGLKQRWHGIPPVGRMTLAATLAVVLLAGGWLASRRPRPAKLPPQPVSFGITSLPPGSTVFLGNDVLGSTEASLKLLPGTYALSVRKEGFEPQSLTVTLQPGQQSNTFAVELRPARPSINIFTPFTAGAVLLDGQPAGTLSASGLLQTPPLENGPHTLRIENGPAKVEIAFEVHAGVLPSVQRPTVSSDVEAIVIAALGDRALIASSLEDTAAQLDNANRQRLKNGAISFDQLQDGSHALTLGSGARQWSGSFNSGPAPSFNLLVVSMSNQGVLLVDVRGADQVHILVNGADRGTAQPGKHLPLTLTPGNYVVEARRDGYTASPGTASVSVAKGASVPVAFVLSEIPKPAPPPPPPVVVAPPPPPPVRVVGTVRIEVNPAQAEVTFGRAGENPKAVTGAGMELDPGEYVFTARAPGFVPQQQSVEVRANSVAQVAFTLVPVKVEPKPPVTHSMNLGDWDQQLVEAAGWYTLSDSSPAELTLYKFTPLAGAIEFKVQPKSQGFLTKGAYLIQHQPKIQFVISYRDQKNYTEVEFDRQTYRRLQVSNGKSAKQPDKRHGLTGDSFTLRLTINRSGVLLEAGGDTGGLHRLDDWSSPDVDPTAGRFGFRFRNSDPLKFTDFLYTQNP
jgi:hypothetical protein